jgi:hypothetical protein
MVFQAKCLVLVCRAVIFRRYTQLGCAVPETLSLNDSSLRDVEFKTFTKCLVTYVSIKQRLIVMERNQLKLKDASAGCASFLRRISILLSCPHSLVLGNWRRQALA